MRAVDRFGLKPLIHRHYPLAELANALDDRDRGAFGKLVITLDGNGMDRALPCRPCSEVARVSRRVPPVGL